MNVTVKYAICSATYYVGSLTEHAELWWFTADDKWVDDIEDAILFESEETAQTAYQDIVDTQELHRFHGGSGLNIVDVLWNDCSDEQKAAADTVLRCLKYMEQQEIYGIVTETRAFV